MIPSILKNQLVSLDIQTIVDVGASDGRYSKALWPTRPEATYILVDPIEYPNKWEGNKVNWVHKALLDKPGLSVAFSKSVDLFGSGCYGDAVATQTVGSTTLSELCDVHESIFVKLDTHGVEMEILGNHLPTLRSKIPLIQIEAYNFNLSPTSVPFFRLTQFMENWGYRVMALFDVSHRSDGCLWQMDLLFAHKENSLFNNPFYT